MSTSRHSSCIGTSPTLTFSISFFSSSFRGGTGRGRDSRKLFLEDRRDIFFHHVRISIVQICTFPVRLLNSRPRLNLANTHVIGMAFVTYILLSALLAGLRGAFHPELLGLTATTAFAIVILEILGLKFGCYLLAINNESQLLDLMAYSGYKFVGIIVTLAIAELLSGGKGTGGWIGWTVFGYTFAANAFFLVSFHHFMKYSELFHDTYHWIP
jgi:hypothetical protein